jgi:predicted nucleic acid-binding protein
VAILLYFDTNVLCRPFDDQTQRRIRRETEAFECILEKVRDHEVEFVISEILVFEIQRIISPIKRSKASGYLHLSKGYHVMTEETWTLAEGIIGKFKLEPRDALHAACALLAEADFFLSCDDGVTKRFKKRSLSVRLRNNSRTVETMNPRNFVARMGW